MDDTPQRHKQSWLFFWIICTIYFLAYFHRVSISVIVSDLLATFNTDAATFGLFSSMYFYLYAAEQPLVGFLADRLGARRVIGLWTLIAATGSVIFALAPTISWASAGRVLIGLGVGGVYVPGLQTMAVRFRPNQFTLLMGVFMAAGNLGAVVATSPLAWASSRYGWRSTFLFIGAATLMLAVLTLTVTRDHPPKAQSCTPRARSGSASGLVALRADLATVLLSKQFWIMGGVIAGVYGTFVTLQGLWATPFLMLAFAIDRIPASVLNMAIPVGVIIGAPLAGWLADQLNFNKRHAVIIKTAVYAALWAALQFFHGTLGRGGVFVALLLMGMTIGGFLTLAWSIVRERTPEPIMGLTLGLLNLLPMLGGAFFQVTTGAILDNASEVGNAYTLTGFRWALGACLVANLACVGVACGIAKKAGHCTTTSAAPEIVPTQSPHI